MPRYKITVTAQLTSPIGLDKVRLRAMTGGSVKVIAPDIARIVLTRSGTDESCAANKAVMDITRAVSPLMRLTRPATWFARPTGLRRLALHGTRGGSSAEGWGDDDGGLGGGREPRRPLPSAG